MTLAWLPPDGQAADRPIDMPPGAKVMISGIQSSGRCLRAQREREEVLFPAVSQSNLLFDDS